MRVGLFEILPTMIPGTRHATNARNVRTAHLIVKLFFSENSRNHYTCRGRQLRPKPLHQIQPGNTASRHIRRTSESSGLASVLSAVRGDCLPNPVNDFVSSVLIKKNVQSFKQQEITDHCLNPD